MNKDEAHAPPPPLLTPTKGWSLMALSWLVPGAGYLVMGQTARALALFFLIQVPFAIGIALSGAVLPPVIVPGDMGANIVNSLTLATQMGNGLTSGVWLAGALAKVEFFMGQERHALFELASFHILVSGALNYFSVCGFYDRYLAPRVDEASD